MDIKDVLRNEARILRHFVCDKCGVQLRVITGDREATLAECPRCQQKFNISISITPLTNPKG